MLQTDWPTEFERFNADRQEPEFLFGLRQAGWQRYQRWGFPTRRHEAWRATDLSQLAAGNFRLGDNAPVDPADLPPPLNEHTTRLVFVNGRYTPSLSRQATGESAATVCNLAEAVTQHSQLVQTYLDQTPDPQQHVFAALNSAFLQDGALVQVPSGQCLSQPVELIFYGVGEHTSSYPRCLVVLGDGAEATVVEQHLIGAGSWSCPSTEIAAGDGAQCHYYKLDNGDLRSQQIASLRIRQGQSSQVFAHLLSFSGMLNRTDVAATLAGTGGHCAIRGLTLAAEGELGDYHVHVEHQAPGATSQQVFKSVLQGKSKAVFDGIIKVVKDAQKTDASQMSRALLLSKKAMAQANPRLEILADDVQCAHGSTVGFLDPDAMFYLRSRGIPEAAARALLVYAFANEQIEAIPLTSLRERLAQLVAARFAGETTVLPGGDGR